MMSSFQSFQSMILQPSVPLVPPTVPSVPSVPSASVNYMIGEFQKKFELKTRLKEAERVISKYPDRLPLIVEYDTTRRSVEMFQKLDRQKYLVPKDCTAGQFMFVIRKRIQLKPQDAMYMFFGKNTLVNANKSMDEIYESHKNIDKFLYVQVAAESTFGLNEV